MAAPAVEGVASHPRHASNAGMDGMQLHDGHALPKRHRFTLDDAIAMNDAGVFPPDSRIELIDGELFD